MDPNLKQRIIDEAYVLFLTKGMKQTSFCDVAAAVHKSKGAVMHYFSSKRHLIDTVVKMRFFPASQLSPEMDYLEGRRWDEFLRSYKNPIERVIDSFPEKLEGNGLMYYMQFVSSANEYMDEFPQMYHELLAREQDFLFNAVVVIHKQSVDDIQVQPAIVRKFHRKNLWSTAFSNTITASLRLKPHFSNVNGTFALHLNTFSFVIIWKDLSLRIIKYRLVGFYCSLV